MNREKIKEYQLSFNETCTYFFDHVQSGNTLAQEITKKIDFRTGKFFTFLPQDAEVIRLYEFGYGGIMPTVPYGDKEYKIEGVSENFHPEQVITMDGKCSEFISDYVMQKSTYFAVIDNVMLKPDSLHVNLKNIKMLTYKNEVYYFLDEHNSVEEIYAAVRKLSQSWHFLSVLTYTSYGIPSSITSEILDQICNNTKFIIVGAYDGEGFLFWKRGN